MIEKRNLLILVVAGLFIVIIAAINFGFYFGTSYGFYNGYVYGNATGYTDGYANCSTAFITSIFSGLDAQEYFTITLDKIYKFELAEVYEIPET